MLQQRNDKSSNRMLAKIRRYISDSQTPIGIAIVVVNFDVRPKRQAMKPIPFAMLLGDGVRIEARVKVQGVDQRAVRAGVIRPEGDRPPRLGQRFVETSLVGQRQ